MTDDLKRLEALREAVRRHCHEVRQPVLGIMGYADMLAQSPEDAILAGEAARQIATQAERLRRLCDELTADACGTEPATAARAAATEVRGPLEAAVRTFGYRLAGDIAVESEVPADARACIAPGQLEQIAINLLANALDALPGRGRVQIRVRTMQPGVLAIEVADDGRGIPPELQARLFTPGTTTKPAAGHGLGLAISREMAHAAGGTLELVEADDSWPQPVTTVFRLTLPAA